MKYDLKKELKKSANCICKARASATVTVRLDCTAFCTSDQYTRVAKYKNFAPTFRLLMEKSIKVDKSRYKKKSIKKNESRRKSKKSRT